MFLQLQEKQIERAVDESKKRDCCFLFKATTTITTINHTYPLMYKDAQNIEGSFLLLCGLHKVKISSFLPLIVNIAMFDK